MGLVSGCGGLEFRISGIREFQTKFEAWVVISRFGLQVFDPDGEPPDLKRGGSEQGSVSSGCCLGLY